MEFLTDPPVPPKNNKSLWRNVIKATEAEGCLETPWGRRDSRFWSFAPRLAYIWERQLMITSPWLWASSFSLGPGSSLIPPLLPFTVRLVEFVLKVIKAEKLKPIPYLPRFSIGLNILLKSSSLGFCDTTYP